MSLASLTPKGGNDKVYTPDFLVNICVGFLAENSSLSQAKTILEPCKGSGAFLKAIPNALWCEVDEGRDFFEFKESVDFIVTNPPWSQTRKFLQHSMSLSDSIAFLIPVNHLIGLKARMRDMKQSGFWVTKVLLLDTPKEFPQSGFQLGLCLIEKTVESKTQFFY